MKRAVLLMLVGMSLIPAGDTASKVLTSTMGVSPLFVAWCRFGIGAICILPVVLMVSGAWASLGHVFTDRLIWARGILTGLGVSSITMALQTTDLATAFGGLFFAPVVSFVTAALFLKEPITLPRTALILAGFVGVLLVAQPGAAFTPGMGFALLAGTCYGLFLTLSRAVTFSHSPFVLLFSQLIIATAMVTPFGLMAVPSLTTTGMGLILASSLFSMFGNLLLIMAYGIASATRLAPLVYFQLIVAFSLGWIVFNQIPNTLALIGLVVIAVSGFASVALKR